MSASPRLAAVRALGASRPSATGPSTRDATGRTAGAPGTVSKFEYVRALSGKEAFRGL